MLRQLRKKKIAKKVLWILAILIVPAFVLWGAGSTVRSKQRGPSHLGKIYGKRITFKKFAKSHEAYYHQLILSSGGNPELLNQMKNSVNINQMAWGRLIMLEEAKRQRIKVTDKEIIDTISSSPFFQRKGIFDKQLYDYILRNNLRTTPRDFEEEMRENLVINKLRDKILEGVSISENELLEEYKKENEKIKISFVLVNPEDFAGDIKLNTEELEDFYEKSKEDLTKGDEVNLRYFQIDSEDTELLYKITEEINADKDFDKIARQNKLEIKETGFFGVNEEIPNIGWSYELKRAAFALEEGMSSFPINTQKGYYVINVKKKRTGYLPNFQEAEPLLNKKLIKIKSEASAEVSASDIYKQINDMISQGLSFEKAAKKLNLTLKTSEPFSRKDYIEGMGQANLLKEVAFALPEGDIHSPIRCEKGFAIFRVDELMPADEKKFEDEKEKLKQRLLMQKKQITFQNWFDKISENTELEINLELLPR